MNLGPVSDLEMLQVLLVYRCYKILGPNSNRPLTFQMFLLNTPIELILYLVTIVTTNVVNWLGSFSIRVIQQHSLEVSLNSPGERTKNCI